MAECDSKDIAPSVLGSESNLAFADLLTAFVFHYQSFFVKNNNVWSVGFSTCYDRQLNNLLVSSHLSEFDGDVAASPLSVDDLYKAVYQYAHDKPCLESISLLALILLMFPFYLKQSPTYEYTSLSCEKNSRLVARVFDVLVAYCITEKQGDIADTVLVYANILSSTLCKNTRPYIIAYISMLTPVYNMEIKGLHNTYLITLAKASSTLYLRCLTLTTSMDILNMMETARVLRLLAVSLQLRGVNCHLEQISTPHSTHGDVTENQQLLAQVVDMHVVPLLLLFPTYFNKAANTMKLAMSVPPHTQVTLLYRAVLLLLTNLAMPATSSSVSFTFDAEALVPSIKKVAPDTKHTTISGVVLEYFQCNILSVLQFMKSVHTGEQEIPVSQSVSAENIAFFSEREVTVEAPITDIVSITTNPSESPRSNQEILPMFSQLVLYTTLYTAFLDGMVTLVFALKNKAETTKALEVLEEALEHQYTSRPAPLPINFNPADHRIFQGLHSELCVYPYPYLSLFTMISESYTSLYNYSYVDLELFEQTTVTPVQPNMILNGIGGRPVTAECVTNDKYLTGILIAAIARIAVTPSSGVALVSPINVLARLSIKHARQYSIAAEGIVDVSSKIYDEEHVLLAVNTPKSIDSELSSLSTTTEHCLYVAVYTAALAGSAKVASVVISPLVNKVTSILATFTTSKSDVTTQQVTTNDKLLMQLLPGIRVITGFSDVSSATPSFPFLSTLSSLLLSITDMCYRRVYTNALQIMHQVQTNDKKKMNKKSNNGGDETSDDDDDDVILHESTINTKVANPLLPGNVELTLNTSVSPTNSSLVVLHVLLSVSVDCLNALTATVASLSDNDLVSIRNTEEHVSEFWSALELGHTNVQDLLCDIIGPFRSPCALIPPSTTAGTQAIHLAPLGLFATAVPEVLVLVRRLISLYLDVAAKFVNIAPLFYSSTVQPKGKSTKKVTTSDKTKVLEHPPEPQLTRVQLQSPNNGYASHSGNYPLLPMLPLSSRMMTDLYWLLPITNLALVPLATALSRFSHPITRKHVYTLFNISTNSPDATFVHSALWVPLHADHSVSASLYRRLWMSITATQLTVSDYPIMTESDLTIPHSLHTLIKEVTNTTENGAEKEGFISQILTRVRRRTTWTQRGPISSSDAGAGVAAAVRNVEPTGKISADVLLSLYSPFTAIALAGLGAIRFLSIVSPSLSFEAHTALGANVDPMSEFAHHSLALHLTTINTSGESDEEKKEVIQVCKGSNVPLVRQKADLVDELRAKLSPTNPINSVLVEKEATKDLLTALCVYNPLRPGAAIGLPFGMSYNKGGIDALPSSVQPSRYSSVVGSEDHFTYKRGKVTVSKGYPKRKGSTKNERKYYKHLSDDINDLSHVESLYCITVIVLESHRQRYTTLATNVLVNGLPLLAPISLLSGPCLSVLHLAADTVIRVSHATPNPAPLCFVVPETGLRVSENLSCLQILDSTFPSLPMILEPAVATKVYGNAVDTAFKYDSAKTPAVTLREFINSSFYAAQYPKADIGKAHPGPLSRVLDAITDSSALYSIVQLCTAPTTTGLYDTLAFIHTQFVVSFASRSDRMRFKAWQFIQTLNRLCPYVQLASPGLLTALSASYALASSMHMATVLEEPATSHVPMLQICSASSIDETYTTLDLLESILHGDVKCSYTNMETPVMSLSSFPVPEFQSTRQLSHTMFRKLITQSIAFTNTYGNEHDAVKLTLLLGSAPQQRNAAVTSVLESGHLDESSYVTNILERGYAKLVSSLSFSQTHPASTSNSVGSSSLSRVLSPFQAEMPKYADASSHRTRSASMITSILPATTHSSSTATFTWSLSIPGPALAVSTQSLLSILPSLACRSILEPYLNMDPEKAYDEAKKSSSPPNSLDSSAHYYYYSHLSSVTDVNEDDEVADFTSWALCYPYSDNTCLIGFTHDAMFDAALAVPQVSQHVDLLTSAQSCQEETKMPQLSSVTSKVFSPRVSNMFGLFGVSEVELNATRLTNMLKHPYGPAVKPAIIANSDAGVLSLSSARLLTASTTADAVQNITQRHIMYMGQCVENDMFATPSGFVWAELRKIASQVRALCIEYGEVYKNIGVHSIALSSKHVKDAGMMYGFHKTPLHMYAKSSMQSDNTLSDLYDYNTFELTPTQLSTNIASYLGSLTSIVDKIQQNLIHTAALILFELHHYKIDNMSILNACNDLDSKADTFVKIPSSVRYDTYNPISSELMYLCSNTEAATDAPRDVAHRVLLGMNIFGIAMTECFSTSIVRSALGAWSWLHTSLSCNRGFTVAFDRSICNVWKHTLQCGYGLFSCPQVDTCEISTTWKEDRVKDEIAFITDSVMGNAVEQAIGNLIKIHIPHIPLPTSPLSLCLCLRSSNAHGQIIAFLANHLNTHLFNPSTTTPLNHGLLPGHPAANIAYISMCKPQLIRSDVASLTVRSALINLTLSQSSGLAIALHRDVLGMRIGCTPPKIHQARQIFAFAHYIRVQALLACFLTFRILPLTFTPTSAYYTELAKLSDSDLPLPRALLTPVNNGRSCGIFPTSNISQLHVITIADTAYSPGTTPVPKFDTVSVVEAVVSICDRLQLVEPSVDKIYMEIDRLIDFSSHHGAKSSHAHYLNATVVLHTFARIFDNEKVSLDYLRAGSVQDGKSTTTMYINTPQHLQPQLSLPVADVGSHRAVRESIMMVCALYLDQLALLHDPLQALLGKANKQEVYDSSEAVHHSDAVVVGEVLPVHPYSLRFQCSGAIGSGVDTVEVRVPLFKNDKGKVVAPTLPALPGSSYSVRDLIHNTETQGICSGGLYKVTTNDFPFPLSLTGVDSDNKDTMLLSKVASVSKFAWISRLVLLWAIHPSISMAVGSALPPNVVFKDVMATLVRSHIQTVLCYPETLSYLIHADSIKRVSSGVYATPEVSRAFNMHNYGNFQATEDEIDTTPVYTHIPEKQQYSVEMPSCVPVDHRTWAYLFCYLPLLAPTNLADALTLLTPPITYHKPLAAYAVRSIRSLPGASVWPCLPQLIQCLRFDVYGIVAQLLTHASGANSIMAHCVAQACQAELAACGASINATIEVHSPTAATSTTPVATKKDEKKKHPHAKPDRKIPAAKNEQDQWVWGDVYYMEDASNQSVTLIAASEEGEDSPQQQELGKQDGIELAPLATSAVEIEADPFSSRLTDGRYRVMELPDNMITVPDTVVQRALDHVKRSCETLVNGPHVHPVENTANTDLIDGVITDDGYFASLRFAGALSLRTLDKDGMRGYLDQMAFIQQIVDISGHLVSIPKLPNSYERNQALAAALSKIRIRPGVYPPTEPEMQVVRILADKGRTLQSAAKVPILVCMELRDRSGVSEDIKTTRVIFKSHDDIRQDALALQIMAFCQHAYTSLGAELKVLPYRVLPTSVDGIPGGVIECVPNAMSRHEIGTAFPGSLKNYYLSKFGKPNGQAFLTAQREFLLTLAGYAVSSYILQVKDRHNGNIMINDKGDLIHIDFGFIFDISPGGNMCFERPAFKLTKEMVQLMGGDDMKKSPLYAWFVQNVLRGFLATRTQANAIIAASVPMLTSTLECFLGKYDESKSPSIERLRDRLGCKTDDFTAVLNMHKLLKTANSHWRTNAYDWIQSKQQKIYYWQGDKKEQKEATGQLYDY